MNEQVLDLRTLGSPGSDADERAQRTGQLMEAPFNQEKERESVRGKIALRLVGTLVGVVIVVILMGVVTSGVCAWKGSCDADISEMKSIRAMTEAILTPLVGLVGAVTGFYFGEKQANANPNH